jgi:hypothetical protein
VLDDPRDSLRLRSGVAGSISTETGRLLRVNFLLPLNTIVLQPLSEREEIRVSDRI